jgi:hypothetical protein
MLTTCQQIQQIIYHCESVVTILGEIQNAAIQKIPNKLITFTEKSNTHLHHKFRENENKHPVLISNENA